MIFVTCPKCGAANPENGVHCSNCGARLVKMGSAQRFTVFSGVLGALLLCGLPSAILASCMTTSFPNGPTQPLDSTGYTLVGLFVFLVAMTIATFIWACLGPRNVQRLKLCPACNQWNTEKSRHCANCRQRLPKK